MNLFAHLERTGAVGKPSVEPGGKPFVKRIVGMGNWRLGLVVLFLASVMVLTRDAFHGTVRLALALFGGRAFDPDSMTWEKTYGDLLRKIGKHPSGSSPAGGGGGSMSGASPALKGGGDRRGVAGGEGGGGGGARGRSKSANSDGEREVENLLVDSGESGGGGGDGGGRRSSLEMGVLRGAGSEPLR